jgi:hypothetical protein
MGVNIMRYAVIKNNSVVNVIVVENPNDCADLNLVKSETANIGDEYANGEFITQKAPVIELTSEELQSIKKSQSESDFKLFLEEKDIDSIGEASALLNSTNPIWKNEAQRAIELWDLTWQAFYNNEPLPALTWL